MKDIKIFQAFSLAMWKNLENQVHNDIVDAMHIEATMIYFNTRHIVAEEIKDHLKRNLNERFKIT